MLGLPLAVGGYLRPPALKQQTRLKTITAVCLCLQWVCSSSDAPIKITGTLQRIRTRVFLIICPESKGTTTRAHLPQPHVGFYKIEVDKASSVRARTGCALNRTKRLHRYDGPGVPRPHTSTVSSLILALTFDHVACVLRPPFRGVVFRAGVFGFL